MVKRKHADREHRPFGGSSLGRRYHCPASFREERRPKYLPPLPKEAAEIGVSFHEAVETLLLEGRLEDWLSEEDRELVEKCVAFARAHERGREAYVEEFLELHGSDGKVIEDAGGTPDLVYVDSREVIVIDWKFYHEPLDELDAVAQIASYVASACQRHGRSSGRGLLYLPRLDRTYEYECSSLETAVKFLESIRNAALSPDAPHNPGSWCNYCLGSSTCPALYSAIGKHVSPWEAKQSIESRVRELTISELEHAGELVVPAEVFASSVRARIKALKKRYPERFSSWSLETRGGRRSADTLALFYALQDHLTPEEYVGCTTVNVKQAEERYVEKAQERAEKGGEKLTKKAAREDFSSRTAGIVTQPKSEQLRRTK